MQLKKPLDVLVKAMVRSCWKKIGQSGKKSAATLTKSQITNMADFHGHGVEVLQSEIDKARDKIKGYNEKIKKVTGRDAAGPGYVL